VSADPVNVRGHRTSQSGGKGWVRLSPRGVQEGQEVDPAPSPVPNPRSGKNSASAGASVYQVVPVAVVRRMQNSLPSGSASVIQSSRLARMRAPSLVSRSASASASGACRSR
jgi:hypothetical protein